MTSWIEIDHEPAESLRNPKELLLGYLDYYRAAVLHKIDGMAQSDLRGTRLPSGWTPLELVQHLAYVERRWMQWGFLGQPLTDVFGDRDSATGRWHVDDSRTSDEVIALFVAECNSSREIAAGAELSMLAQPGKRFRDPDNPPALSWILFHVLQEYARHVGHLDIVRELADGSVGEAPPRR